MADTWPDTELCMPGGQYGGAFPGYWNCAGVTVYTTAAGEEVVGSRPWGRSSAAGASASAAPGIVVAAAAGALAGAAGAAGEPSAGRRWGAYAAAGRDADAEGRAGELEEGHSYAGAESAFAAGTRAAAA
ncbi:hypothetical protein C8F04DRAFT_1181657 [Mycena alexandri]|uniref:Uncharacterized protein n=1 Tax=Mycena alexandri TaxID=1745969 RepID=A0AAD6SXZ4_9AGAR|nr:hypothetical protein C8F04DRAFT_1181657 [Mycena alexandri]